LNASTFTFKSSWGQETSSFKDQLDEQFIAADVFVFIEMGENFTPCLRAFHGFLAKRLLST